MKRLHPGHAKLENGRKRMKQDLALLCAPVDLELEYGFNVLLVLSIVGRL